MPLRIGETFAGYRILRLLGSGGMGEVYLVQHPRLPRHDALKVLRPDVSSDTSFRERFIREADLAAGLRHPHIVGIHDRGEHDGQLWIAMDYIDGTDAAQLMQQRYPAGMPAELAIPIITAVASALDYAHKKGLLHRDVKPANIIVADLDSDDRRVFLADFGIARPLDDTSGITTTNMTVGTVAYAAPEQLMGEQMDGRADQYALAATTYHLLTGLQLFPHSNPAVVISRHLNTTPPALGDHRPDLAGLDGALQVALAKDPDDRYPSCTAFAHALASNSPGHAAASPSASTQAAPRQRKALSQSASPSAPRPPAQSAANGSRRAFVIVGSAAVLVLLIGVIALAWRPWDKHESKSAGTSTLSPPVAPPSSTSAFPPTSSTPEGAPPAEPLFSAHDIDKVLLTADQLSNLLGATVTDNPAGGGAGGLALESSAYGTSDHSGQVTPRSCVGVVFTGEHDVYTAAEAEQIKTQTFGHLYGSSSGQPHLLQQTAAVFPSAELAQRFLSSTRTHWESCAQTQVDATLGYENGAGYQLGAVQRDVDLISVAMATYSGENGPDACQQALGVRENVVVETRTCKVPDVVATYDPALGWPRDPAWAGTDAKRIATAMLDNVKP